MKIWAEAKGTGHVAVDVDGETYVSNVPDRRKESTLAGTGDLRVGPEGELKKGVNIYEKPSQIPRTRKDDDEAFTKKVGPPVVFNFGSTIFQGNVIRDQTLDMQANGLTYRIAPSKSTDKEGKETYLPPSNCISTSNNVLGNSANQEHKDAYFSTIGNTDKMQTTEFLKAMVTFAEKVGATVHYPETAKSSEGGATAPTSSPPSGGGSSSDGGGGGSSSGGGGGGGGGGTE